MPHLALLAVALLLLSGSLSPASEQKEISELYRRGLAGDKAAVEQCIGKLEKVLQLQPQNQLARVYLGSAYTLRSRDLGYGPRKLQTLRQGLAVMDEAVATAPENPKVRLARALTTSALPPIFGRGSTTRKDFLLLADAARRSPDNLEAGDLQVIYYEAGRAANAAGDRTRARELWQQGLQHPADAVLTQKLHTALAGKP